MAEKHVPSEETARDCFLDGAAGEYLPEDWNAFLARVKRDAAREALDGLAREFERRGDGADMADQWAWEWRAQDEVEEYQRENYPEETP